MRARFGAALACGMLMLATACTEGTAPTADTSGGVRLTVAPSYAVADAAVLPITHVRLTARQVETRTVLGRSMMRVDGVPAALPVALDVELPEGKPTRVLVYVELINITNGVESVQWSGVFGPLEARPGGALEPQQVTLVRGGLENLAITSVAIARAAPILEGQPLQLEATVIGAANPTIVWRSLDPAVATVDEQGRVRGVRPGTARILATAGLREDTLALVIRQRIERLAVDPEAQTLTSLGAETTLSARGVDPRGEEVEGLEFDWFIVEGDAIESLGGGRFRARAPGHTVVEVRTRYADSLFTATSVLNVEPTARTLELTPASATIEALGGTASFGVIARDELGNVIQGAPVTWTTADPAVATIDAAGVATGVGVGTTQVRASAGSASAEASLTVRQRVARIEITPNGGLIDALDEEIRFSAVAYDAAGTPIPDVEFTWFATPDGVLGMDGTTGAALTVGNGTATIIASAGNARGAVSVVVEQRPVDLAVQPAAVAIESVGETRQFEAALVDRNQRAITAASVAWSSDDPAVLAVDAESGLGTARGQGTTRVRATAGSLVGTAEVTVAGEPVETLFGRLTGRVVDAVTGSAVAGAEVSFVPTFVAQAAARRIQISAAEASTVTGPDGRYTSPLLPVGNYRIIVNAPGFIGSELFGAVVQGEVATPVEQIPVVPASSEPGSISGVVQSAVTGARVAGARVELRRHINNATGQALAVAQTTQNGAYTFAGVAPGVYTVRVTMFGYAEAIRTGIAVGGTARSGQDVFLSPLSEEEGELRIVLTWGSTPRDLDSHLTGPTSQSSRFHVFYSNPGSATSSPFARLDFDVTTGSGPETITIARQLPGVYRYSVHDYSNRGSTGSTGLANSGARVDVYRGSARIAQYFVPAGTGTLWTVFEIEGGVLRPVNTMSNQSLPSAVQGVEPVGLAADDVRLIDAAVRATRK